MRSMKNREKRWIRKKKEHEALHKKQDKLFDEFNDSLKKVTFIYPLIWEKNEDVTWDEIDWDIFNEKEKTFIFFINTNNYDFSYILSAFIGKRPDQINMVCKIKRTQISDRFAEIGESSQLRSNKSFYAIYSDLRMFNTIIRELRTNRVPKSNIVIILARKDGDSVPNFSYSIRCELHVLFLSHKDTHKPYRKEELQSKSRELSIENQIQEFNTIYHFVEAQSLNFRNEGPRCNTTLKEAFHSILYKS